MNKKVRWRIIWIIVAILFMLDLVISYFRVPKRSKPSSSIPKPDYTKGPKYYDFYDDRWVYEEEVLRRANESKGTIRQDVIDEDDIQEYLEDHIDGYKEKTYWGEEWDEPDED